MFNLWLMELALLFQVTGLACRIISLISSPNMLKTNPGASAKAYPAERCAALVARTPYNEPARPAGNGPTA
jgi:hypothetical protein